MYEVEIKISVDNIPEAEDLLELFKKLELNIDGIDMTHFSITKKERETYGKEKETTYSI
jgi:hypothetical protein